MLTKEYLHLDGTHQWSGSDGDDFDDDNDGDDGDDADASVHVGADRHNDGDDHHYAPDNCFFLNEEGIDRNATRMCFPIQFKSDPRRQSGP